uniref:C2H2-type domain-containing protein n=1 Tax=Ixodes ricinus TaxID=34613 RepID=A0A147BAM0_IXORI
MDERHRARTYEGEDSDNLPLSLWLCLQDIQETSVAVKKEPSEATSYNEVGGLDRGSDGRPSFHDWWDRNRETTPGLHRDRGRLHPHSSAWAWHGTSREDMRVKEKRFGCRHCPRAFGRELLLRAHEESHTGRRPQRCVTCKKRVTRNTLLRNREGTLERRKH